jgi:membrane protease YdiL (CAAX protease family)
MMMLSRRLLMLGRTPQHGALATISWTAAFAIVLTALVSGIWSALLLANLKISPTIPWSALIMAPLLWALWAFLRGNGGPKRTRDARRRYLRAVSLPGSLYVWAVIAGLLAVVFLAGLWTVLGQLVTVPGHRLPEFSQLPAVTVAVTLAMACIAGAVSEEAGFRGYFQGTLERYGFGAAAILLTALLMAPVHALTQGFVWPTMLFYLLVDAMLGALAYFTKSIGPGVMVHAVGLFAFFALVWPHDKDRHLIWQQGADSWFWIHVGQTILFAVLSIIALLHLAKLSRQAGAIPLLIPQVLA